MGRRARRLTRGGFCAIFTILDDGDCPMAKGQMRSNKEKRKPKQSKDDKKKK